MPDIKQSRTTYTQNVTLGDDDTDTISITGRLTGSQGILLPDEAKLFLGTGEDSYIMYGDPGGGDNTFVLDVGTDGGAIYMPDNTEEAFQINEAGNVYMSFVTSNGQEEIQLKQDVTIFDDFKLNFGRDLDGSIEYITGGTNELVITLPAGGGDIAMPDNDAEAFEFRESSTAYMVFNTTNSEEKIEFKQPVRHIVRDATAAGGGFNAITMNMFVAQVNDEIVTTITVDIGDGNCVSSNTAGDVIGENDTANAYLTRMTTAINGVIYRGEMACIEVPTTGDPDINLTVNGDDSLAEDENGESVVMVNGGVWTVGASAELTIPSGGIQDDFIYLTHGGTTAGTYNAGKFIIKFYGADFGS